jgi:energy-coupling factor transport system ATP-binding protein
MTEQNVLNGDLVIENLHFVYPPPKKVEAIKLLNLKIKEGEFVAIVGHNGSGKTTLSKLISGYLNPTEGSIKIGGLEVKKMHPRFRPTVVGYVFQNPDQQVFKDTVWEDVTFGLNNLKLPPDDVKQIAEQAIERLDLTQYEQVHPFRLGKGDRQRVAFAGILVMRPKILIVDEPTTGQDPEKAREIMRLLTELNKEMKITVIVVTHAMELVAEFCRRVVVMGEGGILLDDSPQAIFSQPDVLARTFIRPPQICRLGLELGIKPIPLTTQDMVAALITRNQNGVAQ